MGGSELPFAHWPTHLVVRSNGPDSDELVRVWFTPEPPRLYMQVVTDTVDLPVARANVYATDLLIDAFPDLVRAGTIDAYSDWLRVRWYTPDARAYMQLAARPRWQPVRMASNQLAVSLNTLAHMGVRILSGVLALVIGTPIRFLRESELAAALDGVDPGAPDPRVAALQEKLDAVDFRATDPLADALPRDAENKRAVR